MPVTTRSAQKLKERSLNATNGTNGTHSAGTKLNFSPEKPSAQASSEDALARPSECGLNTLLRLIIGFSFLAFALPSVAVIVGSAVGWYYIDPVTPYVVKFVGRKLECLWGPLVRRVEDKFVFNCVLLHGVFVPCLFLYNLLQTIETGEVNFYMAYAYHLIRIGPYFMNFAYVYTLCHKEGHVGKLGLFSPPASYFFRHVFNWWIGLFYGVMPSSFAYGHTRNHHRYNNDESDVVTTWDRPRDSFINYVRYLPRFLGYALNFTAIRQFCVDGEYNYAVRMIMGSVFYFTFFGTVAKMNLIFALVFLAYPLVESSLLLSAINWAWHCFLDPDTSNVYASSITIFDGDDKTNILNEDYHVVHHQYPGAHWSTHPKMYKKHEHEYVANKATCFHKTHAMEIFFLAILKQYGEFADRFVDLSGEMSRAEIEKLLKTRLRTCSWGDLTNKIK